MKNIETSMFLNEFVTEAKSHVEKIEAAFLDVEALAGDYHAMNSVFRSAHSLKGTAGFFSLKKIVTVAHELESVFLQIQDGKLMIDDEMVDVVLQSIDCLNDLIDHTDDDSAIFTGEIVKSLKSFSHKEDLDDDDGGTSRMPFDFNNADTLSVLQKSVQHGHKMYFVHIGFNKELGRYYSNTKELVDNFFSVGTIIEASITKKGDTSGKSQLIKDPDINVMSEKVATALSENGDSTLDLLVTSILDFDLFSIATEVDRSQIRLLHKETVFGEEDSPTVIVKQKAGTDKVQKKQPEQDESSFFIRLDISVINNLMDLANEMILTRNQLFSSISGFEKTITGLPPILHDLNRLTSEIQEKVMYTRMQPISVIFNKFPRIIRDTAKSLGKDIYVEIPVNNVTLDKYLLEALTDPITQIVKNSADHGLESSERRAELGKSPKGLISLNAYMRDSNAIIEITDDGSGINADALKRKALEHGVASEEALAEMPDSEVYNLIFEPGISTAKVITNYSGRGVGMDIVKTNIENLGGSIEIESELNVGTTMRLKVPMTLSVIRSLIVKMDGVPYAVPELNVERIVRIWSDNTSKRIEKVNKSLVLSLDKRIIPVVTIHDIEGKARGIETMSADEMLRQIKQFGVVKCLVLRAGDRCFALLIDDALETEQVLVKPLPVYLHTCMCYSNVTVLGSGQAVMILDAEGTMRFMGVNAIEDEAVELLSADSGFEEEDDEEHEILRQVMLFHCSGPEYFAIDIEDISRIEVIEPEDIQLIGKDSYVNIAGETIRVVRPEDYSPVRKRAFNDDQLYLLCLKNSESNIGLLVRKVIDKVDDAFILDETQVHNEFVTGTSAYNKKILIFLNTAAIADDVERKKRGRRAAGKGGVV